jgi:Peptidase family M23
VRDEGTSELRAAIRASAAYRPDAGRAPLVLRLPFTGSWLTVRTPARRVPSHGTHFLGQTFAFDFVAVDARRRTAAVRDWRTVLATEPADRFFGFGAPVLAPAGGRVVAVHEGEEDHVARRSPLSLLPYAATQGARLRDGIGAVAGNYLMLALADIACFVLLAHLQRGTVRVRSGDRVTTGEVVAACGNSGNSTQPHVHVQAMDSVDPLAARGLALAFRDYVVWDRRATEPRRVKQGVPGPRERVEPL